MASVSIGQAGPAQTTRFGLPIDYAFEVPATETRLQAAARALRENGFQVEVVDSPEDARKLVDGILPQDKSIFTGSSETVRLSGLDEDINRSERFKSVRQELAKMDRSTQFREMVRMGAAPDVIVGSVHAVTEDGRIVVGSASGSQLGPYAAGAEKVVLVVGAQKVVPDLETAMRRVETYSYPKEDTRMREAIGRPSSLAKILIINRELAPGRTTVVLVRTAIGF